MPGFARVSASCRPGLEFRFSPQKNFWRETRLARPVHSNQGPAVIETLKNEGHDHRIKAKCEGSDACKTTIFVEQNNDNHEKAAQKKAELEFPESLKNTRRNEHYKNRAECPSPLQS